MSKKNNKSLKNKNPIVVDETSVNAVATAPLKPIEEQQPVQNSFLIEKHRYTKGRLNARVEKEQIDPPLCLRFGSHFIKSTFLLNQCNSCEHATTEQVNLMQEYNKLCEIYDIVRWQVNKSAMEACSMTKTEINLASTRWSISEKKFSLPSTAKETIKFNSGIQSIFDAKVAIRRRKRVLVPISGGLSSMATLWWCLLKDYDVFLCYAFGALENTSTVTEKPAEVECLLRLLQYARKLDGKLLFDNSDDPESGVNQLTRAEIAQRIRVVQVPLCSYYFPEAENVTTWQPYCFDNDGLRMKAHPQSYLLFYRQMVTVAQSLDCSGIALGMHGDAKQLLSVAREFFNKIHPHVLFSPFETRTEALVSFQEAAQQSWDVWKSYFQRDQTEHIGTVWQTAGPALMPNASHYVSTCSKSTKLAREQLLLQAQTAALERVQSLLEDEIEKESAKIDAATARGEKIRRKRAPDPFQHAQYLTYFIEEKAKLQCDENNLFHFCNNCIDCWQWRKISSEWSKQKPNSIAPQWQNLANEYIARINATANINKKKYQDENTIVVTDQELSLADLKTQHKKNDEEEEEEEDEEELAYEDDHNVVEDEQEVPEEVEDEPDNENEEEDAAELNEAIEDEEEEDEEDEEEEDEEEDEDDMIEDVDDDDDGDDGSDY